jgi:hypothetical protein
LAVSNKEKTTFYGWNASQRKEFSQRDLNADFEINAAQKAQLEIELRLFTWLLFSNIEQIGLT